MTAADDLSDFPEFASPHWTPVGAMENPAGYLYRIIRSRLRHRGNEPIVFPVPEPGRLPDVEPRLPHALARLTERQRITMFLVAGCDRASSDVAALLGISVWSVRNHLAQEVLTVGLTLAGVQSGRRP